MCISDQINNQQVNSQQVNNQQVNQPVTAEMLAEMGMDWSRIEELAGGFAEFELELLTIFVDDTQLHLDAVRTAIAAQNFTALAQEAHHIKGASANVGAVPMQEFATRLEQQARQQDLQDAIVPLDQLQTWLDHVRAYVYHPVAPDAQS